MDELDKLIRAAQQGDDAAFEVLLDHCYEVMYRYAAKWCSNTEDAEDITQQACIKLAKNINQFSFQAAFTSWLYRLVINCAKDWQRSQRRHEHTDLSMLEEPIAKENTAHNRIYLQQLLSLIASMGEGFKETVILVLGEGLSHREAATILSVKESTISWRIHEVRKQLSLSNEAYT